MSLSCVQCGAPFAGGDATCRACGLLRTASLPPGLVDPALLASPPDPEPPLSPGLVEVPAPPEPPLDTELVDVPAPAPDPGLVEVPAPPEPPLDTELVDVPAPAPDPAPEESFPAPPAVEPTELGYAPPPPEDEPDVYNYGPQDGDEPTSPRRPLGAFDVLIALLGAALAFAVMFLVNDGDVTKIQDWLVSRGCAAGKSCGDVNVHDLLVSAVEFSPFAIAAFVAMLSRVPGVGFLVAAVSQVPVFLFGNFHASSMWPLAIPVAVFLLTDLLLFLLRRGLATGLLTGLLAGAGAAAYPAVTFLRADKLDYVTERGVLVLQFLVVPGALVLVAGIIGGLLSLFRRR